MSPEHTLPTDAPQVPSLAVQVASVLWPAFLMAGVLVALIFVVVDPATLSWFGGEPLDWPRQAVYSVTFFICWGVIAVACTLTWAMGRHPAGGSARG